MGRGIERLGKTHQAHRLRTLETRDYSPVGHQSSPGTGDDSWLACRSRTPSALASHRSARARTRRVPVLVSPWDPRIHWNDRRNPVRPRNPLPSPPETIHQSPSVREGTGQAADALAETRRSYESTRPTERANALR